VDANPDALRALFGRAAIHQFHRHLVTPPPNIIRHHSPNRLLERVAVHEAAPKGMLENLWFSPSCKEKGFKVKVLFADGLDRHPVIGKLFGIGIHAGVFLGDRPLGPRKQLRYQSVPTSGGRSVHEDLHKHARVSPCMHGLTPDPCTFCIVSFAQSAVVLLLFVCSPCFRHFFIDHMSTR
jgi:hypothetical protein